MYASYADYTSYLGGRMAKIPQNEFDGWSKKASFYMDSYSSVKNATTASEEIKFCCCEIAELLKSEENIQPGIISENNDGYSVQFDTSLPKEVRVYRIMKFYLLRSGYLFRGVRVC